MVEKLAEISVKTSAHAANTIFFADENVEQRYDLTMALSEAGHIVIKVTDGRQLLTLLSGFTPDCIILSSTLPDNDEQNLGSVLVSTAPQSLNGTAAPTLTEQRTAFALCQRLAQTPQLATVPILLTVIDSSVDVRMSCLQAKAWDCIVTSIQPVELLLRIQHHIEMAERIRSIQEEKQQIQQEVEQKTTALQEERKQRRQSEQKSALLLDALHGQNQQLQLLMSFLLSELQNNPIFASGRKQLVQEQLTLAHHYLERLHVLTTRLHELDGRGGASTQRQQEAGAKRLPRNVKQQRPLGIPAAQEKMERSPTTPELNHLSEREYEILIRLASGESYQQIADAFSVSPSTIRSYRSRIMQKLRLNSSTQMIKYAVRHGLVKV
jgi:DNA-binding NarL/FixJ family response regulator